MKDITAKPTTLRSATAEARIHLGADQLLELGVHQNQVHAEGFLS